MIKHKTINKIKKDTIVTLGQIIQLGEKMFLQARLCFYHGTDNAWDEAVRIATFVLNISPFSNRKILNNVIALDKQQKIIKLFKKRINTRLPAAYITNLAYFTKYEFYVDRRVMIPRSPIGEIISKKFVPWLQPKKIKQVLDMCTGSGCLGISTALYLKHSNVDLVDKSKHALNVARKNVKKYNLENRVNIIQSDLFNKVYNQYDLILSNPPYVSHAEYSRLPKEFYFEPSQAFLCKNNGLEIVEKILKTAYNFLKPNGAIIFEVGNSQSLLKKKYPKIPFNWIDLQQGGQGVFILYRDDLLNSKNHYFSKGNI